MSTFAVCIIVMATGQAWGTPVVYEAELTAPVEIEGASPRTAEDAGQTRSWDLDSSTPQNNLETSPDPVRELHWEYDDDGRPVARPSDGQPAAVEQPAPVDPPRSLPEPRQSAPEPLQPPALAERPVERPRDSRPVATFWLVLPQR